jgi:hypothetical protein
VVVRADFALRLESGAVWPRLDPLTNFRTNCESNPSAVTVPKEITELPWREPWHPIESPQFEERLAKEVGCKHVLYKRKVISVGRRYDMDDVLFYLPDGPGVLAAVGLTWSSRTPEPKPELPWTDLYSSVQEFIDRRMIPDADEMAQAGGSPDATEEQ